MFQKVDVKAVAIAGALALAASGAFAMLDDDAALKAVRVERCVKDLRGFAKVSLKPGETKVVTHRFTARDFAYWDDFAHCFRTDAGRYEVLVGASSADIRGKAPVAIAQDAVFRD